MIEFKNVKLNIKNIDILYDLNFVIKDNSVTCFVGNKNSGKSSILKLLVGIYENYKGEVLVDGNNIKIKEPLVTGSIGNPVKKSKRISMVHEKRETNTDLNVIEYLEFYASLVNKKLYEVEKIIENMLKNFSIMSYKYTNLELLDNETYKLVDIIRVMIEEPDIILFDNLFSSENLDFNEKLLNFIKSLVGKKTLVFASRNLKYVENICEYLGVLDAGALLMYDDMKSVFKKAELNKKVEVELFDGIQEALNILKDEQRISNIIYENNKIIFSIDGNEQTANEILKKLIDNNIKVFSFKKQTATFEQLFSKLKVSNIL